MILLVYEITEFIISWVDIVLPSITIKITGSAIQDTSLEVRDHRIMNVTLNSTCVARKVHQLVSMCFLHQKLT